jgi:phenylacetic acid degradation operon negative regulatory protein
VLLTVLGEFVLRRGGPVWTSSLLAALSAVGFSEKNGRQAIARLAEQGLLAGERVGRQSRWELTDGARRLLTEGTERIFAFLGSDESWDGQWLIVAFSVPEDARHARARLRKELGFSGFGFPGPGVAVCAHPEREERARAVLERLGVSGTCLSFRGRAGHLSTDRDLVERSWDLETLAAGYRGFLDRFGSERPADGVDACRAITQLVHEWRRFPFIDPELPDDLLPAPWPGHQAKSLFDSCHSAWLAQAMSWFDQLDARA